MPQVITADDNVNNNLGMLTGDAGTQLPLCRPGPGTDSSELCCILAETTRRLDCRYIQEHYLGVRVELALRKLNLLPWFEGRHAQIGTAGAAERVAQVALKQGQGGGPFIKEALQDSLAKETICIVSLLAEHTSFKGT